MLNNFLVHFFFVLLLHKKIMILFTLLTLAGLAYARGLCPLTNATQTWFSVDAKNSNFSVPAILDEDLTSFIVIDAPSTWNATTKACECPKQLAKFTYWNTNGTYDDKKCIYDCERCQVFFCVDNYSVGIVDTFNVVVDNDGLRPTCKKGLVFNTTATATNTATATVTSVTSVVTNNTVTNTVTETDVDDESETDEVDDEESDDDMNVEVGVHVSDGNYNYNYSYKYPNATATAVPSKNITEPTKNATTTTTASTVVVEP
jgi:hypothetical protein